MKNIKELFNNMTEDAKEKVKENIKKELKGIKQTKGIPPSHSI
jgi:hypothetical protein